MSLQLLVIPGSELRSLRLSSSSPSALHKYIFSRKYKDGRTVTGRSHSMGNPFFCRQLCGVTRSLMGSKVLKKTRANSLRLRVSSVASGTQRASEEYLPASILTFSSTRNIKITSGSIVSNGSSLKECGAIEPIYNQT